MFVPRLCAALVAMVALLASLGQPTSGLQQSQQQQQQLQQPQQPAARQPAPIRKQLVKKYRRPNHLPRASTRINCAICASDFMSKRVTIDDPCFNPRYNLTVAELELISECPLASRNCITETVYANGVLTSIKRKCGQPYSCTDTCVVAGLGLTSKTCSVCCPPFEYDTYNTDHLKARECA